MKRSIRKCSVNGCGNLHAAKGFCDSHYRRSRKHGNPLGGRAFNGEALSWLRAHKNHRGEGCLIWPFGRKPNGYARVDIDQISHYAHRVMCTIAHGQQPSTEHEAAHSCGKGHEGCVHPLHLSWKTKVENEADKLIHGTHNRGESHGRSKLTESDVVKIRSLRGKMTQSEIGEMFNVGADHVSRIQTGAVWAWLDHGLVE